MTMPVDWKAATEETVRNLSRLIQADTTNPPGNELPAIQVVQDILEREGLPGDAVRIVESAPNRVNLVARLRGDGSARPLLLSGHVDVVPVEREHWTRDPFGGEVADGCVWGRGALDMKGFLAMYMQVFMLARRHGLPLKRDLILAAIADEEALFTHGSRFLVDSHRELIDAEYGLTEGGAMTVHAGKVRLYPIQVAEKGVCWMRMTSQGEPGHGSMPHADNAVLHLARALDRLRQAGHLPIRVTPTFKRMVQAAAAQTRFPMSAVAALLQYPAAASLLLKLAPARLKTLLGPMLADTVTPTMLQAGAKINVIPSAAEARLDCRMLPGQTPADVMREILAITGPGVQLETTYTTAGTEFPTDSPLYKLLEQATRRMDPGGVIAPMLMAGATDASEYQRAGITMYGFTPGISPEDFPLVKLGHGHDERLPVSFIESGLPALWEVITQFCA